MCAYRAIAATILPTGTAQEGLKVSEVTMQTLENHLQRLNFAARAGGLLHQDHTWATMRHCRLHLVASAKISA